MNPTETLSFTPPDWGQMSGLLTALQPDLRQGLQWLPATIFAGRHHPPLEVELPAVITDIVDATQLRSIGQTLRNAYPADHPVTLAARRAPPAWQVYSVALRELAEAPQDNHQDDQICALYLPPLPPHHSITALQEIVAHLRSPQGCPWDREQTLASLRHDLLSECAEVVEAIDAESTGQRNTEHIAEELGDLILAALLMVQVAIDEGRFQLAQPMYSIVTKLIRRHPHVFGTTQVDGVQTVLANWDAIKAQERAAKGAPPRHPLDGIPAALPALEKARQLQSKAAKAGLLDRASLAQNSPLALLAPPQFDEITLGELLWQLVALAHQQGLNAEDALRSYVVRYRAVQGGGV
jgi:tetrapyrrole methylase family protein/MazG family protein